MVTRSNAVVVFLRVPLRSSAASAFSSGCAAPSGEHRDQERQALRAGDLRGVLGGQGLSQEPPAGLGGAASPLRPPRLPPAVVVTRRTPLVVLCAPPRFSASSALRMAPRFGSDAAVREAAVEVLVEPEGLEVAGVQAPEDDGERLGFQAFEDLSEASAFIRVYLWRERRGCCPLRALRLCGERASPFPESGELGVVGAVVQSRGIAPNPVALLPLGQVESPPLRLSVVGRLRLGRSLALPLQAPSCRSLTTGNRQLPSCSVPLL